MIWLLELLILLIVLHIIATTAANTVVFRAKFPQLLVVKLRIFLIDVPIKAKLDLGLL